MIESISDIFKPEFLAVLIPLLIAELCLIGFCTVKIFKEGVANLNKWVWLGIVVIGNLTGSIIFLLMGRRRDV
jgi:hypothetical protein